jgi:hypothetical protein
VLHIKIRDMYNSELEWAQNVITTHTNTTAITLNHITFVMSCKSQSIILKGFRQWSKSRSPVMLSVVHLRQNHLEYAYWRISQYFVEPIWSFLYTRAFHWSVNSSIIWNVTPCCPLNSTYYTTLHREDKILHQHLYENLKYYGNIRVITKLKRLRTIHFLVSCDLELHRSFAR